MKMMVSRNLTVHSYDEKTAEVTAEFGLSAEALKNIKAVFAGDQRIERVRVFGSRALGRQRPGSDVDLAIDSASLKLDV